MIIDYPEVEEIIELHDALIMETGGSHGLRDRGLLESAHGQLKMTFGGVELYPTIFEKAAALMYSLIKNHPFVDGNKRTAYLITNSFLRRNGYVIHADVKDKFK